MAFCTNCKQEKLLTEFYKSNDKSSKNRPIGRKSHCKDCIRYKSKIYYNTTKGRKYIQEKSWKNKGFAFTVEEYEEMLIKQNYKCAICGSNKNKNGTRLCVDHDHSTGKVRGLLCHDCNTSLGKFKDSVELLNRAINYINLHKEIYNDN